jgi:hypothetical protein
LVRSGCGSLPSTVACVGRSGSGDPRVVSHSKSGLDSSSAPVYSGCINTAGRSRLSVASTRPSAVKKSTARYSPAWYVEPAAAIDIELWACAGAAGEDDGLAGTTDAALLLAAPDVDDECDRRRAVPSAAGPSPASKNSGGYSISCGIPHWASIATCSAKRAAWCLARTGAPPSARDCSQSRRTVATCAPALIITGQRSITSKASSMRRRPAGSRSTCPEDTTSSARSINCRRTLGSRSRCSRSYSVMLPVRYLRKE